MPARRGLRVGGGWPATPTAGQLASAQGSQGQRCSVRGSEALCAQQVAPRRLEKSSGAREETSGPRGSGERGGPRRPRARDRAGASEALGAAPRASRRGVYDRFLLHFTPRSQSAAYLSVT